MADATSPDPLDALARDRAAQRAAWEGYLYPGTDTLRNRAGIRDPDVLAVVERAISVAQLTTLPRTPHTPEGYRDIHRHLMGDLYDWAGENRRVDMTRTEVLPGGRLRHDEYLPARLIDRGLDRAFRDLMPDLRALKRESLKVPAERDVERVAEAVARHVGELNFVHAFREGNGRAMRAQADNLARDAGLRLNEASLDPAEWNRGSHETNADPANTRTLARAVAAALEPFERQARREQQALRGAPLPRIPDPARDRPGPRQERDYGLGD